MNSSNFVLVSATGKKWLNDNWKLCPPLKNENDFLALKNYLVNVWTNLAMVDYPYPASFLAPLPANPVKVSITHFI